MKEILKKIIEPLLGYGIISFIIIVIISLIAILGSSLMSIFGFEYTSIWNVILFFIFVTIVDFPIDIFIKSFSKVLISLKIIDLKTEKIFFVLIDTLGTSIAMALVDYFMDSIYATDLSILIFSFILAIFSLDSEKNK